MTLTMTALIDVTPISALSCPVCDDGDGGCAFPYYGVAPHDGHGPDGPYYLPRDEWFNFVEDPDSPGCGTYMVCPSCGRPGDVCPEVCRPEESLEWGLYEVGLDDKGGLSVSRSRLVVTGRMALWWIMAGRHLANPVFSERSTTD